MGERDRQEALVADGSRKFTTNSNAQVTAGEEQAGAGSPQPSSGRTQLRITPKVTFCAVVGVNGSMEMDVAL